MYQAGLLLNFDLTATAFVEEGPVLSFAQDVLRISREQLLDHAAVPHDVPEVERAEVGEKVLVAARRAARARADRA